MTMRFCRLEAKGFRGIVALDITFANDLVVVEGENGSGKSSMLQAIEWCLFGSEIASKSKSGIAARVDFEVLHRGTSVTEVAVTFDLGADEPTTDETETQRRLTLRRQLENKTEKLHLIEASITTDITPTPKVAGPLQRSLFDEVATATPRRRSTSRSEDYLDEDAVLRLRELGFPDFDEWRRSFCQYQEDPRHAILESKDRSTLLASMLGLDAWTDLRARIEGLRARRTLAELDAIEADLGADYERSLQRGHDGTSNLRARLESQGVVLDAAAVVLAAQARRRLLDKATSLCRAFEIDPTTIDDESPELLAWTRSLPSTLRAKAQGEQATRAVLERREALAEAARRARKARADFERLRATDNGLALDATIEGLEAKLTTAQARAATTKAALQREDARVALLREARAYLREREATEACPLCDHAAPDLALRIERELDALGNVRMVELRAAADDALQQVARVSEQLAAARKHASELEALRRARDDSRARLHALLGTPQGRDALDEVDVELRRIEDELATRRSRMDHLEADLVSLREEGDVLQDLERLAIVEAGHEAQADPDVLPSHAAFEAALDRAAEVLTDLEALARFAREEEAAASRDRLAEVERDFGRYLALVLTDDGAARYRIQGKGTAQNLRYDVVDASGKSALAIANQASLSALSFALLFSRAEARSDEGRLAAVLLDDPCQSLDDARARGLARAVVELSKACPLIVAAPPGGFVEELRQHGAQVVALAPNQGEGGVELLP